MKKTALILLAAFVLLTFTACGDVQPQGDTNIGGLFWDILHGERGDSNEQASRSITFKILNNTGGDIADIGISWSQNGELLGSRGMEHADNTPYKNGEECTFVFLPEDFTAGEMTELRFEVFAGMVSGEDYTGCGEISIDEPVPGSVYSFELRLEDGRCSLCKR